MTIWMSPYNLQFRPISGWKERGGVLLKFVFADGSEGYSDLHPWTELGDPSIKTILDDLRSPPLTQPMAARCVALARKDARARTEGRFLGGQAEGILSHKLIPYLEGWEWSELELARELGYTHFKIKMPELVGKANQRWRVFVEAGQDTVVWRIDMNARPSEREFEEWLGSLSETHRQRIDFVEDPCPYSEGFWSSIKEVEVAADRAVDLCGDSTTHVHAQVMIVKPELQDGLALVEGHKGIHRRYVVTNNLGHPFSFAAARAEACELYRQYPHLKEVCGLQGLEYYEPSAWTEKFKFYGPRVSWGAANDTGFGFDDLLKEIPWKRL